MRKRTKVTHNDTPASNGSVVAEIAAPEPLLSVTLGNLQTAYSVEANAQARYLAFARGADEEGYAPVASLFRAAARSEDIHASNLGEAIRNLGAEPKVIIEGIVINSTHEHLETTIKRETCMRDEMYPTFLRQARLEKLSPAAARTFHLAQKAEAEHAALFNQTLQELERLRGGAQAYYVCPVCGFMSSKADGRHCPVCSTPADRFEKVS
jgi:rubrerythrin